MRSVRILFLTPSFDPAVGGVEKHVSRVAHILTRRGYDVTVMTVARDPSWERTEVKHGVRILRPILPGDRPWQTWLRAARGRSLKEAEIVHCHDAMAFVWYLPWRVVRPSVPVFTTFHGWEGVYPIRRMDIALRRLSERLSHGSICVGHFLMKWYRQNPTHVTYGGVDPCPPAPAKDDDRAVFVGQLRPDTGVREYVAAFTTLAREGVLKHLDIVGDGPLRSEIQAAVSSAGPISVRLHGVAQDPLPFYASARFAFVSGYLTLLEAMANRCVPLSVYADPVKEDYFRMFPRARGMVVAGSASELVRSVVDVKSLPLHWEEAVEENFAFACEQTWEKLANLYEDLWHRNKPA